MSPVAPSSTSPVGRAPALTVKVGAGDPVAVTVNEYDEPTVAGDVGAVEVITGTLATTVVYASLADAAAPLEAVIV